MKQRLFLDRINKKSEKWSLILIGIASLVWFLIRVIPKPSRASYPCQRAAFPLASAFILWIAGVITTSYTFKSFNKKISQAKYVYASFILLVGLMFSFALFTPATTSIGLASDTEIMEDFIPTDKPNEPIGEGKGIFPGRVVWSHNPEATSWNGSSGNWWYESNTDAETVYKLLAAGVGTLTGAGSEEAVWDSLFHYFNRSHSKGNVGYKSGETIAIKLNMNQIKSHDQQNNILTSSPQVVISLLRQIINKGKVPASAIILYDLTRHIPDYVYNVCIDEFPELKFVDNSQGQNGRSPFTLDTKNTIEWSENLVNEFDEEGKTTYLPTILTEASYMISLGNLKGHGLAGVTICAKNHFGTYATNTQASSGPVEAGVHPYIAVHYHGYTDVDKRPMGTYNPLVDIMGHKHIGDKTLLYLVDALYTVGGQNDQVESKYKMKMSPFNGDWMSSLFVSLDGVAIESVGLDFLRSETGDVGKNVYGNVDNYLHEAAQANDPPSETSYDPEGDGTAINTCLGVHEHWNDALNKQYSRNLGHGKGIELIYTDGNSGETSTSISSSQLYTNSTANIYPNPVINYASLKIVSDYRGEVSVQIFSIEGKRVSESEFSKSNEVQNFQLPVYQLKTGTYICYVISGNNKQGVRFIKK